MGTGNTAVHTTPCCVSGPAHYLVAGHAEPGLRLSDYIHKEFPKTCAPDDFFGQVKRSVNGKPVPQEQIDMIVKAIRAGLTLSSADWLLDLGCGNGALSRYLFDDCSAYLGVDFSDYLIQVAQQNFEVPPDYLFSLGDAVQYVLAEPEPERFTRVLCYGAFSYLSHAQAEQILRGLSQRFVNVTRLYIGNLPDKDRAHLFYPHDKDFTSLLDDRETPIGIWRSEDDTRALAARTGWYAEVRTMPEEFYAAHYRFDVLLTRVS